MLLAAPDGRDGSIQVHQDLTLWMTRLGAGAERGHAIAPGRHAWVHVARGPVSLNGHALAEGDGAALSSEPAVELRGPAATPRCCSSTWPESGLPIESALLTGSPGHQL